MLPSSEGLSRPRLPLNIPTLLQRVCISHVVSRKFSSPHSRIFCLQVSLSSTSGALLPPKCPSGPPSSLSPSRANKKCLNGIFIRAPSLSRSLLPLKSQLSNGSFHFFPKGPTNIRRHENFTDGSFRNCAQRLLNARTVIIRKIFENTGEPNRDEIVFSSISHLTRTAAT